MRKPCWCVASYLHVIHLQVLLILCRQQQVGVIRGGTELVTRQEEKYQSGQLVQ